ncbi:MAG: Asp-tRNA(Asn)/Glu-tRNA(Gln) amidotransferase subunit GatA [SAR202 cluster bacterium]|nr:Asp-tRNA(Asn)/Glu-tRNA(Gln) amidotransferase subunit GatA [SAR202 cluster bacterium]
MTGQELCRLTIAEAAESIAQGQLSPVELIQAHLERIEKTQPQLNSFITLLSDEAVEEARRAEAEIRSGRSRGPLHGIPIGLKDLYYTKGIRTTVGSEILRDFVPDYDAAVTERFRDGGAIIIGKLQMHEFALGSTSTNPHYGPARNPWNTKRVTGGSSGGSGAAVAAGQCMGALGSDTGGSIRIPSGLCGIVGFKPTFGRVSRHGVYPLAWTLDTVGPMTRAVRDSALIMNVIAGHDPRDQSSTVGPDEDFTAGLDTGVRGLRVGVPEDFFYDVIDPEVSEAVERATGVLTELGASVERVSIPVLNHSLAISSTILMTEAAEVHATHLKEEPERIGADVRGRLHAGTLTPAVSYIKAQRARTAFNRELAETMTGFDVLVAPTTVTGAPGIDESVVDVGGRTENILSLMSRLTRPFNICGYPTVSVPCGFTSASMPIGLQIAARPFDDSTALRAAHAYEQATEWHTRRPPV